MSVAVKTGQLSYTFPGSGAYYTLPVNVPLRKVKTLTIQANPGNAKNIFAMMGPGVYGQGVPLAPGSSYMFGSLYAPGELDPNRFYVAGYSGDGFSVTWQVIEEEG